MYYSSPGKNPERAGIVLDKMMKILPAIKYPMPFEMTAQLAFLYKHIGRTTEFQQFATETEQTARARIDAKQADMNSMYNPYSVLLELYDLENDHVKTLGLLHELEVVYPNDPGLKRRIQEVEALTHAAADTGKGGEGGK